MLRDVFYYGEKPNAHPREKFAKNLADARHQAKTDHFWIINEFCDYRNFDWDFDFEFLADSDVWAIDHNNVWPSVHQKDSGTWLCPKKSSDIIIYRNDVSPISRKKDVKSQCWVMLDLIDETRFDFGWHPDPTDPPYIYKWGSRFCSVELKSVLEYKVPGATAVKYMKETVELLPEWDKWHIIEEIDKTTFDFTWRPDPREPEFIYVFGNHLYDGTVMPTIEYRMQNATVKKYINEIKPKLQSNKSLFEFLENSDGLDYSWRPDPTSPPYIYAWGNQWNKPEDKISVQFVVPGATEYKYMEERAIRKPCLDNWITPDNIDDTAFDYSWEPSPADPPFIYEFGTQWQKTGGPSYIVTDATQVKYIDILKAKRLPSMDNWTIPKNVDVSNFDFSWHPDATSPPYIYHFATQWAMSGGPIYTVPNAKESKYIDDQVAKMLPDKTNWKYDPELIEEDSFDFSWHPYLEDQPYIYQFGTQWQKTGGPQYVTPGCHKNSPIKYIDTRILKAKRLPNKKNFAILDNLVIKDFDFSWHPDDTEEPYVYVFGNNLYSAEIMPTIEYTVKNAKQIKYVNEIVATLDQDKNNWIIPSDVDITGFDFSWKPNPKDPDYVYQFGTQWQKTGGPRYVVGNATEVKYIETQKVKKLSNKNNWTVPSYCDVSNFDFSWHPDDTSPPYIYVFPTQWALSGGPTYTVPGATEVKYVEDQSAVALPDKTNWQYDSKLIDENSFDFSWHPYVEDQPYIYQFGTQWQKTGGPRYVTPGCHKNSPIKYIDTRILKAKRLPSKEDFAVLENLVIQDFDYSWHPDDTEEPYIYQFGNNLYPAEIMPTIEYRVKNAKQVKYINNPIATLGQDKNNWVIPDGIDTTGFDFSWKPNPKDPDYIYEFATQWQKNGGPKYVINGATEIKYMDNQKVKKLVSMDNWTVPANINVSNFDFSWHPDNTSPPYIYVFATQWALSGGPVYTVEGATEVKYVEDQSAIALPDKTNWQYDPKVIDEDSFDFSWHPYIEDQPYVYQFGTQWQKTGGPQYITPGCHKNSPIKYIDTRILKAKRLPNKKNFSVLNNYKIENFDYSWHPDETEEPYVYVFGNKQYPAEVMPTVEYIVTGAKTIKYVHEVVAELAQDKTNWEVPKNIDVSEFDFSWKPNPNDPDYIYQFGTQWQKTGGPRYVVPGAKQVKYVEGSKAKSLLKRKNYTVHEDLVIEEFDYSWHPDETEPPYIYVFPTQWVLTGGPVYTVEGATEVKYLDAPIAKVAVNMKNWEIPSDIVLNNFDFSWHPHPNDPTFIYQFGTQWQKTGGPRYIAKGATTNTPIKYIDTRIIKATVGPNMKNWEIPTTMSIDKNLIDFSWHPDATSPPVIYQFGTLLNQVDGPRYICPGHDDSIVYLSRKDIELSEPIETPIQKNDSVVVNQYYIQTSLEDLVNQHPNEVFWALNKNINYDGFDFDWRPETIRDMEYVQVFGSPDSEATHTYLVNALNYLSGKKDFKYIENIKLNEKYLSSLFVKPDIFFVDRGNSESNARFERLKLMFGKRVQKTRYLNSWVDTINRCCNRASTDLLFVLNSELDYSNFDFNYYPNPWQLKMVHVFGTQWSHWGTTFMVNKESFANDTKYIKIIEHLSNLNFVKEIKATSTLCHYDIILIDHGNLQTINILSILQNKKPNSEILVFNYENTYLQTLKNIVEKLPVRKEHFIWICSSICDYNNFDFSYIIDPFSRDQLHVFPSDRQKFGDTFFVDVNKLRELINDVDILENYKVNYNQSLKTSRLSAPIVITNDDTHLNIGRYLGDFPYTVFVTEDNKNIEVTDTEPMSLWDEKTKNIIVTSVGASRIIVPKEAKDHIKTQLYDYPYIKKSSKLAMSKPLDIVFLSNGEKNADENYEHLLKITKGLKNRVTRVDGVRGRMEAYHSALKASETPWAFTVFAKLKVSHKFDFNWQPDRLQASKHYIFQAKNPVNGLIYGHQAMIAYNKKLTLNNYGEGLDFTLDDPHEVVELLSGVANYNTDAYSTWRTAFREVIKLQWDRTEISSKRLEVWVTKAEGEFAQYSLDGARDALEYYTSVNGEFEKLKLSYEWDWLKHFFDSKYKPDL